MHGRDVQAVHRVGGGPRLLDPAAPEVVGTGQQIRADIRVLGEVFAGERVDMQQCAVALPVLGRAVCEDCFRHAAKLALPREQTRVPERGKTSKAANLRDGRLRVPVVELSSGSAREFAEYTVENRRPGLIDIEPVAYKLAQQPARLRD